MSVFEELNKLNVNDKVEKKQKLTYLSWAWAWAKVKDKYPDATYKIWKDEKGNPYTFNETLGYMCYTTVCIEDETLEMWLPVMNGANKAMLNTPYDYEVKRWQSEEMDTKHVLAATMFDINKTIMRCLVKNLAMFGLGLYIYAGEDLPEIPVELPQFTPNLKMWSQAILKEKSIDEMKERYSFTEENKNRYINELNSLHNN